MHDAPRASLLLENAEKTLTDLDALTLTVWAEARGEPIDGQIAVANVIKNRSKLRGTSIASICLAPHQFSCWTEEAAQIAAAQRTLGSPSPVLKQCLGIAHMIIEGFFLDNTKGATHYYADYIPTPKWAEGITPLVTIGRHIFLRTT